MSKFSRRYVTMLSLVAFMAATGNIRGEEEAVVADLANDPMAEMMELREKLQDLSSKLQGIQIEAMESTSVTEALESYEAAVKSKMLSLAPDKEAEMDESAAIMRELRNIRDPESLSEDQMEELEVKFARYQELAQELMEVEMEAQQDEEVTTAREKVEENMLAAMNAVNPEAGTMMEEFETLAERFQEIQEAMFMQQMQQMQMMQDQDE